MREISKDLSEEIVKPLYILLGIPIRYVDLGYYRKLRGFWPGQEIWIGHRDALSP